MKYLTPGQEKAFVDIMMSFTHYHNRVAVGVDLQNAYVRTCEIFGIPPETSNFYLAANYYVS